MSFETPLFVLGNPRSGTSLFRLMLTNHPEVCVPPECGFIQWWYNKYRAWNSLDSMNQKRVDSYISDLSNSKKIETWGLNFEQLRQLILSEIPNSYSQLSQIVVLQYAHQLGNEEVKFLGDKNNYYLNHLPLLSELYPQAYYLAIIRDGRDVACSYRNIKDLNSTSSYKPVLSIDINEIANEWVSNTQKLEAFSKNLEEKKFIWVRYEDLIDKPEATLIEVCNFLKIEFNSDMLNYHISNKAQVQEPIELLDWKKKTLEKPDPSNSKKYLKELSAKEILEFESIGINVLKKFRYV